MVKYKKEAVWGCMTNSEVGNLTFIDGILDEAKYLKISKGNLKEGKLNLPEDYYFRERTIIRSMNQRLKSLKNGYYTLSHPPQIPNLTPTEYLWDELDRRLRITKKGRRKTN